MNWKVGDEFIVVGPDHELDNYAWLEKKGTLQVITKIYRGLKECECDPYGTLPGNSWIIKYEHMLPATKLHKALM